jgi:hypothetical protein
MIYNQIFKFANTDLSRHGTSGRGYDRAGLQHTVGQFAEGKRKPGAAHIPPETIRCRPEAYQNSTWVVATAKCGVEDGHPLFGGSCIVNLDGEIVGEAKTESDELVVVDCDLDATAFGKNTIFDSIPTGASSIMAALPARPV